LSKTSLNLIIEKEDSLNNENNKIYTTYNQNNRDLTLSSTRMQNFTNEFNSKTNKFISTRTIFPTFCPSPSYRAITSYNTFNNTQNEISINEKNEVTINIQPLANLTSKLTFYLAKDIKSFEF
jgi:hypothetical protein